ncbi:MAG: SlyX family protein [Pirellula staleyi]
MASNSDSARNGRPSSHPPMEARVQELEYIVSHLQKTVDDLNEALLLQQRKLDSLSRQVEQAKSVVQSVLNADNTPRSLADDKPPHY